MRISLTGRVSIEANGVSLDERSFPGRQGRLVFAYLLAEEGRPVPRDELAEVLWGDAPPATWEKALAVLVSKLRALLEECGVDGQAALRSAFGCYQLVLPPGVSLDVTAASEAVARAEAALTVGDLVETRVASGEAAALARRSFLPGEDGVWVEEKRRELSELLVRALECLGDACLGSGEAREAVRHAEELTMLEPFREGGYRLLMQAHAAAGNNAEALRVYERCRRLLADELGAYPSPETEAAFLAILRATPTELGKREQVKGALEAAERTNARLARPRAVALAIAGVAAAAAIAMLLVDRSAGPDPLPRLDANAVGVIDTAAAEVVSQVRGAGRPAAVTTGGGFLWVATEEGSVLRIDRETRAVTTLTLGGRAAGVAYTAGSVWITKPDEQAVVQIAPDPVRVVRAVSLGNGPGAVAGGDQAVWVANAIDGTVSKIDIGRGVVAKTISVGESPAGIAVGAGAVWVTSAGSGTVLRLDPRSGSVLEVVKVGNGPAGIAVADTGIWVANRQDGTISRIDPATDRVSGTFPVGENPASVAADSNAVWVASSGQGRVARLDPDTGRVGDSIRVGSSPNALVLADGKLWVTTLPSPSSHRGGVLRVHSSSLVCPCLDPAGGAVDPTIVGLVYDGLLAYRRVGGIAGGELIGNLAVGVPAPTNHGGTYSFRLRRTIRYSNGALVRPADFRHSLERLLTTNPDAGAIYGRILGAQSCAARPARRCDLSKGIEVDDAAGRITVHLSEADPDFLYKLTYPLASVVPAATPLRVADRRPVPGTGPYRVASFVPGRSVRILRNRHFRSWSRDARPDGYPDEIRLRLNDDEAQGVATVERGEADLTTKLPVARINALLTKHGSRLHSDPVPITRWMFLNTRVPPFDDVRVRQALNYTVDRHKLVVLLGGVLNVQATCQILPPGFPGYRPNCPYTLRPNAAGTWTAPDLAKAKALVEASGTRGMRVTVLGSEGFGRPESARYFVSLLRRLGYRSSLRLIPRFLPDYGDFIADSSNRVQIGTIGWVASYAAASDFLRTLFACASYHSASTSNVNWSQFCDRGIDREMRQAATVQRTDPVRANALWAKVDESLVEQAAVVPLVNHRLVALVSERVGNYQVHPQWGTLLDQLWVK